MPLLHQRKNPRREQKDSLSLIGGQKGEPACEDKNVSDCLTELRDQRGTSGGKACIEHGRDLCLGKGKESKSRGTPLIIAVQIDRGSRGGDPF